MQVLILVVMEYTLGNRNQEYVTTKAKDSLNPCCNGIYSRRWENSCKVWI